MPKTTIILEGCEPMELLRDETKQDVWFRWRGTHYWPMIEIRGEETEVWEFIEFHWDRDVADQMVYGVGPLA